MRYPRRQSDGQRSVVLVTRRARTSTREEYRNADWRGTNNARAFARASDDAKTRDRPIDAAGRRSRGAVAAERIERVTMCPDARDRAGDVPRSASAPPRAAPRRSAPTAPPPTPSGIAPRSSWRPRARPAAGAQRRATSRARVSTPLLGRPALASRRSAVTPPAARVQNSGRWRGRRLCFTLTRKLLQLPSADAGHSSALPLRGRAKSQRGGKFATGRQEFGGKTVYGSFKPCFLSRGPGKSGRSLFTIKVRTSVAQRSGA